MRQHVAAAHQETGPMLEEGTILLSQKHEVETRKQLLEAFKKHFIIPEEDLIVLTSLTGTVDERFFAILGRLKRIHKDCHILLGTENQQLGLDLMEQSSRTLNGAFQKLYRWIQKEFKTLNLENPQIHSSIHRALRVLAERPSLFQNCLDYFSEAREHTLSESFYSALTGTSTDDDGDTTTKPIDFYAHDPLRYVGDMFAWIHSATVSEREALDVLFVSKGNEIAKGIQTTTKDEPWPKEDSAEFDGTRALEQLVNRDLAGVTRALRQRVEQVIQSHEDPVLAYKIANLIDFYRITFMRLLGAESSVLEAFSGLNESALRQYRKTTRDLVTALNFETLIPPVDLRIPEFLDEALGRLKAIMKSYDASLTPASTREASFTPILADALEPFLEGCETIIKDFEEPSKSIFTINCMIAVRLTLSLHDFTRDYIVGLDEKVEENASTLIEYQHAFFLHTSGLHPLLVALNELADTEEGIKSIPKLETFQKQALTDASQTLDDFLPTALIDAMENLKRLRNSRLAEDITAEAASRFCNDFEYIEGRITAADELGEADEVCEEDAPRSWQDTSLSLKAVFPRTSGEIRVLLS